MVTDITEEYVEIFIARTLKRLSIPYTSLSAMFQILNGVMKKSYRDNLIEQNPCDKIDLSYFSKRCKNTKKTVAELTLSDEELTLLLSQFKKDKEKKPYYMPLYAVELAVLTGMRPGELASLRWDNIDWKNEYVLIDSSEKLIQETRERFVDETKNHKMRYVPLTEVMIDFFNEVKEVKRIFGFESEYIFSDLDGRVNKDKISACMRRKCVQAKIDEKCIYSLRRTVNSKMRYDGVNGLIAGAIIGNSDRVNSSNYTFDMGNMGYKKEVLTKVNNSMLQR